MGEMVPNLHFGEACRPVIFETDHESFPYWGKGSSLLLANANYYYWVTASHVLKNMGARVDDLRISPSDNAQISLPFNEQYTVTLGLTDDEDYKDILMLRIDLDEFVEAGDAPLVAQDMEQGIMPAEQLKAGDELYVIGYPSESNFIDYDDCKIKSTRSVLRAIYQKKSVSIHCHELLVESSLRLQDFDGLSGSPVYHFKQQTSNGQTLVFPLLVGMILRGTASSQIAYFVSSRIIIDIVNKAESG